MSEQINKIIFTTKEAYDKKAAEGSLDPSVVYAIDASQVATTTEVKATVDNSFDKFGLELGINKEGAEFYHTPLDLAGMIKDMVKTKFDVNYTGTEHINFGNGTKRLSITNIPNSNTYITAIQDGTKHGFVSFNIDNNLTHVTIPDAVDVTRDFELKASNIFDTAHDTIKVAASSEEFAIERLNAFASSINTETGVDDSLSSIPPLRLYNNALYLKEQSQKNIAYLVSYQYRFVITDKSITFNSNDIEDMKKRYHEFSDSFYILFVDRTFSSYVDLGTGAWKDFPASVSETTTKLANYFDKYALDIDTTRKNKVDAILSTLNTSDIDVETTLKLSDSDNFEDEDMKNKILNAECIAFNNYGTDVAALANKLVAFNTTNPLKVKAIFYDADLREEAFKKLNELPTLQLIIARTPFNDFVTADKRVPLIIKDSYYPSIRVTIKPGDGKNMDIDDQYINGIRTFINSVSQKLTIAPPDHL